MLSLKAKISWIVLCLCIEILHESRKKKQQDVVLKLDFEKAYDRVNWEFLFHCLEEKEFADTWMGWFKNIIKEELLM